MPQPNFWVGQITPLRCSHDSIILVRVFLLFSLNLEEKQVQCMSCSNYYIQVYFTIIGSITKRK